MYFSAFINYLAIWWLSVGHVQCAWETVLVVLREIFTLFFSAERVSDHSELNRCMWILRLSESHQSYRHIQLRMPKWYFHFVHVSPLLSPQTSHHCITDHWPPGASCPQPWAQHSHYQILQISSKISSTSLTWNLQFPVSGLRIGEKLNRKMRK